MDICHNCTLDNLSPSVNPMTYNEDLCSMDEPIQNPSEYRRVVGSLQYLTFTCPNIQFSINKLSQFLASPRPVHWWP